MHQGSQQKKFFFQPENVVQAPTHNRTLGIYFLINIHLSTSSFYITLIFNGLKMGKVFKSSTLLLILTGPRSCAVQIRTELQVPDFLLFRVKYQESYIGFENLACLQSIENKCKWHY